MKTGGFMRIIMLVFLVTILSTSHAFANKTVTLTTLEWAPYIGSDLKNKGYVHEIVVEAFKRVGYKTDIVFYPWARALATTKSGAKDGLFPEYYDESRKENYVFSNSFPGGPVGLYKRKDKEIAYPVDPLKDQTKALRGLSKFRFGVVRGYVNTVAFDAASFLKKEEVKDDETNLKKLFFNRVQLIFIDKYVAKHIIVKKLPHTWMSSNSSNHRLK
jgi:polar amino acid transport system substrate-binding protein